MGLFDRLRGQRGSDAPIAAATREVRAQLFGGDDDLAIVGEASYQDALWAICGGQQGDRVRHPVTAVLVPEEDVPIVVGFR